MTSSLWCPSCGLLEWWPICSRAVLKGAWWHWEQKLIITTSSDQICGFEISFFFVVLWFIFIFVVATKHPCMSSDSKVWSLLFGIPACWWLLQCERRCRKTSGWGLLFWHRSVGEHCWVSLYYVQKWRQMGQELQSLLKINLPVLLIFFSTCRSLCSDKRNIYRLL